MIRFASSNGDTKMSARYLLDCQCGERIPIRTRQAGESVPCRCGCVIDVPTLRELRQLPAADDVTQEPRRSNWTVAHGLMFAIGILVTIIALGVVIQGARMRSELDIQRPDAGDMTSMTLLETWDTWERVRSYELDRSLVPVYVANRRRAAVLNKVVFAAGIFAAAGLLAVAAALIGGRRRDGQGIRGKG